MLSRGVNSYCQKKTPRLDLQLREFKILEKNQLHNRINENDAKFEGVRIGQACQLVPGRRTKHTKTKVRAKLNQKQMLYIR